MAETIGRKMCGASDTPPEKPKNFGDRRPVSIAFTLAFMYGGLVIVAVVTVLAISLWTGRLNTMDHLTDQAEVNVSLAVSRVTGYLDSTTQELHGLAKLIAEAWGDAAKSDQLSNLLSGALATTTQVRSIAFISPTLQLTGVSREEGKGIRKFIEDRTDKPSTQALLARMRTTTHPGWSDPKKIDQNSPPGLGLWLPIWRDGVFVGLLVANVSVSGLSDILADQLAASGSLVYVLFNDRYVLAHPKFTDGFPASPTKSLFPLISEIEDPVIAAMMETAPHQHVKIGNSESFGHLSDVNGEPYFFIHQDIAKYGESSWKVGSYFHAVDFATDMRRLKWSAIAGLAVLVISLGAAAFFSRRITRPVEQLARTAQKVGSLDFANMPDVPGSQLRELNDAARAFNAMLKGLRWFESYVPKTLVKQLMARDKGQESTSVERSVTVMFTDIVEFTALSETMPASNTADLLNQHFALIGRCVEAEDGIIDKYIGDSLMAVWGAVEPVGDHAERACRAALAIGVALKSDNENRRKDGKLPISVRMGLHSGNVIVGNIGAPDRINYTVIGDTVNTASRLEQLCKEVCLDTPEVSVLISGETAAALGPGLAVVHIGQHNLRGRHAMIEVHRLL